MSVFTVGACSGGSDATTPPPTVATTVAPQATSPTSAAQRTSEAPPTLPESIEFEFRRVSDETEAFSYDIAYPVLAHPDAAITDRVNAAIDQWVGAAVERVSASDIDGMRATLSAQLAPELVNDRVFSVSGVATSLLDATAGTVTERVGWIFSLDDGEALTPAELFASGGVEALASAARARLISDVLGSEEALTVPDGLLPTAANFEAVWLSASGIGVGFDQFQVAAGSAGSPAVLIPFSELAGQLDLTGVLAPLANSDTLPEL